MESEAKQMRISKGEIVAGHPALQVRRFLRRFSGMFFMRCAVERVMQLKPEQAEEFIHEMVALKLIEPTTAFNKEAAYEVGDLGLAFANATATKPIYRETAERVLKEFMERVDAVNASKEYAFRIRGVVLFGSMLSSADRVGDVDVAVDLQPSISDPRRFKRLCDHRRNLAQGHGRSLSTAMDWALWPKKEVVLHLKARSHYLSLHGFDQFMEMENVCYRVLIGDSNLIASQIPTGRLWGSPTKSKHSAVNRRVVGSSPT
jgi:predicted nucleotidyltransferase